MAGKERKNKGIVSDEAKENMRRSYYTKKYGLDSETLDAIPDIEDLKAFSLFIGALDKLKQSNVPKDIYTKVILKKLL